MIFKRFTSVLILILFSQTKPFAQNIGLHLIRTNEGYTYIDSSGNRPFDKTFLYSGRFFDGLAAASKSGYVGYINSTGEFTIEPKFEYALPFHYGIAMVWKNGKQYLINSDGNILFDHDFLSINYAIANSKAPLFKVRITGSLYGIINSGGEFLIKPTYRKISDFYEGFAVVTDNSNRFGMINLKGELIVPFGLYPYIGRLSNNRALVFEKGWDSRDVGFIDSTGTLIFKTNNFENIPYDGYPTIRSVPEKYYFQEERLTLDRRISTPPIILDTYGNVIFSSEDINVLTPFHKGYSVAYSKRGEVYLIDKAGNYSMSFSSTTMPEGVFIENDTTFYVKRGLVNHGQKVVEKENICLPYQYLFIHKSVCINFLWSAEPFQNNYLLRWFKNPFEYVECSRGFKDGLIFVVPKPNDWCYINEKGEFVYCHNLKETVKTGKKNIDYSDFCGYKVNNFGDSIGRRKNPAKKITDTMQGFSEVTILLDSTATEYDNFFYHNLNIINPTKDTLKLKDNGSRFVYLQARDKNNVWRNIETNIPSDYDTYQTIDLRPNEYWELKVPQYDGGYKTKMRVVIKFPNIYDFSKNEYIIKEKVYVSNEIPCKINAAQFVRKRYSIDKTPFPFEDYNFNREISFY